MVSTSVAEPMAESTPAEALPSVPADDERLAQAIHDVRYELIDGQLLERNVSCESSWIGGKVYRKIDTFLDDHPIGYAFAADNGYQLDPEQPNRTRKPDASFISFERLGGQEFPRPWIRQPPELAVEVVSPRDVAEAVRDKAREYFSYGVDVVWIVWPGDREIEVRTAESVRIFRIDETVHGSGPLDGLGFRVGDVFPPRDGGSDR